MCWFVFGYFFGFVLIFIEGKRLTQNMGFLLGSQIKLGSPQTVAHIAFITYFLISFLTPDSQWFSMADKPLLAFVMITRAFIIGVRYGFMSKARYKMMKSPANFDWITNDFLFFGWLQLSPKTLKDEIKATKARVEINEDEFEFTFGQEIPDQLKQKLEKEGNIDYIKF